MAYKMYESQKAILKEKLDVKDIATIVEAHNRADIIDGVKIYTVFFDSIRTPDSYISAELNGETMEVTFFNEGVREHGGLVCSRITRKEFLENIKGLSTYMN